MNEAKEKTNFVLTVEGVNKTFDGFKAITNLNFYLDRGELRTALLGGAAVAAAAYVTDYRVVPKRLTPGWESRVTGRSLAAIYTVLALSLPLRGLLRRSYRGRHAPRV